MPPPKPLSACFMKASRVPPGDQVSAANLSLESSGSLRGFSPLLPTNQISWPWASMQAPTEPSGETEAESQCERRTRGSPPKDGNNPDHGLARLIGDHHRHLFAVGKPFHRPKIGSQLLGQGDVMGFSRIDHQQVQATGVGIGKVAAIGREIRPHQPVLGCIVRQLPLFQSRAGSGWMRLEPAAC